MRHYEQNMDKIRELQPFTHWACTQFLGECKALNRNFRITEAYRPQSRQNQLYAQGRTNNKAIVTWTLFSTHTKRTAFDIVVENCSYEEVEQIANNYGLYRPPVLLKLGDYGHFECDMAKQPPTYTPMAIVRRFQRLIARANTALMRRNLEERLEKFKQEKGL